MTDIAVGVFILIQKESVHGKSARQSDHKSSFIGRAYLGIGARFSSFSLAPSIRNGDTPPVSTVWPARL